MRPYILRRNDRFTCFQKILSFFYPLQISKSGYSNSYIEIILEKNTLVLHSKNANQSNGALKHAFHEIFHRLDIYHRSFESILVIGFGLGSVIELIQSRVHVNQVHAIENNPTVRNWLEKYYSIDGILFTDLNNLSEYDLIILDIFEDKYLPEITLQKDLHLQLKNHLRDRGILIWNTLLENIIPKDIVHLYSREETCYVNRFYVLEKL